MTYWYERGQRDALRDAAPIFRATRARGVEAVGEWPNEDTDEAEAGRSYLAGYDAEVTR